MPLSPGIFDFTGHHRFILLPFLRVWVLSITPARDICVDVVSQAHLDGARLTVLFTGWTYKQNITPQTLSKSERRSLCQHLMDGHYENFGIDVVLPLTLQRRRRQNFCIHPGDTDARSHLHQHRPLPCIKADNTEG